MTSVCLSIRRERKPEENSGLARELLLLLRHGWSVSLKKVQCIKSISKHKIIQLSLLRLLDRLPRFVEPLRGEQADREISDIGEQDGHAFIAMEYLEGTTLNHETKSVSEANSN